jgi:hypothetical protein
MQHHKALLGRIVANAAESIAASFCEDTNSFVSFPVFMIADTSTDGECSRKLLPCFHEELPCGIPNLQWPARVSCRILSSQFHYVTADLHIANLVFWCSDSSKFNECV